jgi:plasmid stabilization system protein ParE
VKIHDYIAQNSQSYALRVVDRLTGRSRQIAQFPQSGRAVPEFDDPQVREVVEGSYRIIYRVKKNQIDVIAVIHGARQNPWS